MKKLLIILAIFLIAVSSVQSQSLNNTSINTYTNLYKTENGSFSFRLKTVYTNVLEDGHNLSYYDDGTGVTISLQIDLGKIISLYGDFNYSSIQYTNNNKAHLTPPEYFSGRKPSIMLIFGTKFYPVKLKALVYLKTGLGFIAREDATGFPPIFNAGLGYEYKLSKVFNVFAEGEAVYYTGIMGSYSGKYPETLDLTFGLGGSINFGNLFK